MKKYNIFKIITIVLLITIYGCTSNDPNESGNVELYLLKSFEQIDNTYQIDETKVVVEKNPLINYADLISYNSNSYTFEVSDKGKAAVENLDHSVNGIAFAIMANNNLVYTGYFWPAYSSASCDWVVTDPTRLISTNDLKIVLGYPGLGSGQVIPDKRNDDRIITIFSRDNKLIN